jgi:type IV secretion system protein VirB9
MTRNLLAVSLMILGIRMVSAEVVPAPGLADVRIRSAVYSEDQVYRVIGRVGYALELEFAPEERFLGLAAGDVEGLAFEAQANHVFLKPRATEVRTNFTVLTSLRHYRFDYRVSPTGAGAPAEDSETADIFALRFTYPAEAAADSRERAERLETVRAVDLALNERRPVLNCSYFYCGPQAIKPESASDDGVHTTFRFAPGVELPAIFARADDGSESLVNTTVSGESVVVHRLSRTFVLRRGQLVGCVVNKGYVGGADRLSSGTVVPGVERVLPHRPDQVGAAP